MHIALIGTDFKRTSLKMRDTVYFSRDKVRQFINSLPSESPVSELVVLSTCNRVEIYYVFDDYEKANGFLKKQFASFHHIPVQVIDTAAYSYKCSDAIRHLFNVVSGIESLVIGENEILGQVREAYFLCFDNNSTDSYLNKLFQKAISVGKQVRTKTKISRGSASISSVAVDKIFSSCDNIERKKILVVGAGTMAIRAIKRLVHLGKDVLCLTNRTIERARIIAQHSDISVLPFEDFKKNIFRFDIVILATAAPDILVRYDDIISQNDPNKNLLMIDIGAPRNADCKIGEIENIDLVTINDLKETADRILSERKDEIESVSDIIEKEIQEFTRWYNYKHKICLNE